MCDPVTIGIAGLAISGASSVANIAMAQQSAQMQAAQYKQQMDLQYQQAQQQANMQNRQIQAQHQGQIRQEIAARRAYEQQLQNNNTAANKSYVQEQAKLQEAKAQAAFKAQSNYAKAIGAQGKVLASGATGQSVGLLALDAERQEGLATAAQTAGIRSAEAQAAVGMDIAFEQAKSANNQAWNKLPTPTQAPVFADKPVGIGKDLGLGIPAYDWSNG